MAANPHVIFPSSAKRAFATPSLSAISPPIDDRLEPDRLQLDRLQLAALNREFLEAMRAETLNPSSLLPATSARMFKTLPATAINAIAHSPYALFCLPLASAPLTPEPLPPEPVSAAQMRWNSAAWFFAWHLSQVTPTRAQLWFGLKPATVEDLRRLPAHELSAWAFAQAHAIKPRWFDHPFLWPDLARHARAGDAARLQITQLLGRQLMTASSR